MKVSKSVMAGLVVVAVVICWGVTVNADPSVWPNQKGELCVHNETTGETARIAVMKTVGNNYIVQGVTTEATGTTLFDGSAVVNGNVVSMSISGSGYDPSDDEVHGFVGTVELDLALNSGWVKMVGFHCSGQGPDPTGCDFSNDGTQILSIVECE